MSEEHNADIPQPDFSSNRVVCLAYPPGSGGKFISACLALSKDVAPMDRRLVGLNTRELHQEFVSRIEDESGTWSDMGLGDKEFWGHSVHVYRHPESFHLVDFSEESVNITEQQQQWAFMTAHELEDVEAFSIRWSSLKVLLFVNVKKWINWRAPDRWEKLWQTVKADSWSETAPSGLEQVSELDQTKFSELWNADSDFVSYVLERERNSIEQSYFVDYIGDEFQNNISGIWDCDWFFDEEQTVRGIKRLYSSMNLSDFEETAVRTLYRAWFSKLDKMRTDT